MIRSHHVRFVSGIATAALASASAWGQSSRFAQIDVGVTNSSTSHFIGTLDGGFAHSDTGAAVNGSVNQSFTGQNRAGATQTMNFTGQATASAAFGQLRSNVGETVSNTYYNANNPIYYDSTDNSFHDGGSPDGLVSIGFAGFTDTLHYGGELQSGYQARYVFHIDGTSSGYGTFASLSVKIANDPFENFFVTDSGFVSTNFATTTHDINGIDPQTISVQFSSQVVVNTYEVTDGSTLSGSANFGATVTLERIDVVDANGNSVSGVTISSDSGTQYPVPEPATAGMLITIIGGQLARRRSSISRTR